MDKQPNSNLLQGLHQELKKLLDGGGAHATFEDAVKDFPENLRGVVPEGLPYSAWQIVEHLRIAQADMLHFSNHTESKYKAMKWPDDYWPKAAEPPSEKAWQHSIDAIHADRKAFDALLETSSAESLIEPFAWGDGQTLLREALQIADHNAYHVGELIVVRRLLGAWKK
ncbi:MAG TPA: DinB family protein [Acidobacteriaceae bacterium]|jgi:hypothetical protein